MSIEDGLWHCHIYQLCTGSGQYEGSDRRSRREQSDSLNSSSSIAATAASDVDTILLTDANTGCREAAVKATGSSIPLVSSCKCDADALNVASAVKNVVIAFCRFLHGIVSSMKLSLWHFLLSLLWGKPFKSVVP